MPGVTLPMIPSGFVVALSSLAPVINQCDPSSCHGFTSSRSPKKSKSDRLGRCAVYFSVVPRPMIDSRARGLGNQQSLDFGDKLACLINSPLGSIHIDCLAGIVCKQPHLFDLIE